MKINEADAYFFENDIIVPRCARYQSRLPAKDLVIGFPYGTHAAHSGDYAYEPRIRTFSSRHVQL